MICTVQSMGLRFKQRICESELLIFLGSFGKLIIVPIHVVEEVVEDL